MAEDMPFVKTEIHGYATTSFQKLAHKIAINRCIAERFANEDKSSSNQQTQTMRVC